MSHGVAELPDLANQLLQNHEAILGAVNTFAREASPELLAAMITNMPADVHRMQHEVNPGTAPAEADEPMEAASICVEQGLDVGASESKYCRYATGFYVGYGAFMAVELVSGAKALVKGVRKASDLATKIRGATNNLKNLKDSIRSGNRGPKTALTHEIRTDGGSDTVGLAGRLESGARAARALRARAEIDDSVFDRLTASQRAELLEIVSKYSGAKGVVRTLGASRTKALFDLEFQRVDTAQFRENIFEHGSELGSERLRQYLDDIESARETNGITDPDGNSPRGLYDEAADDGIRGSQLTGQYGEARSALEYAEEGTKVTVEPGDGIYDLGLGKGNSQVVEVKTREADKDMDYPWVRDKMGEMNENHENALDGDIDLDESTRVLELRTSAESAGTDELRSVVQTAIRDSANKKFDTVRIKTDDGSVDTIEVND